MRIEYKVIPIFHTLVVSLALLSCKVNPNIYDILFLTFISGAISFWNWNKILNNFNLGYHWDFIEEGFHPADQTAGIKSGRINLIQKQKSLISKLANENRGINFSIKTICITALYAYYSFKFSSQTSIFASALSISFIVLFLRANFWGMYKQCIALTIILCAVFFDAVIISKIVTILIFIPMYIFNIKILNNFFYHKLNNQKKDTSLKVSFPLKSALIFLSTFFLLNFLIPKDKSLFDLSSHFWKTAKISEDFKLTKTTPSYFKQNKIPTSLLKNLPINKDLLSELTNLQLSIEAQAGNEALTASDFMKFNKDVENWKNLNQNVFSSLVEKETQLNLDQKKILHKIPIYSQQLEKFAKQNIAPGQLKELQDNIFKSNVFSKDQESQFKVLSKDLNSGKNLELKDQVALEKLLDASLSNTNTKETQQALNHLAQKLKAQQISAVERLDSAETESEYKQYRDRLNDITTALEASKQEVLQEEKTKDWLKDFIALLEIILGIFILNFLYDFFRRNKITHDDTLNKLDTKTKELIKDSLSNTPRRFSSIEDEIVTCYQLFHQTMNTLFYNNQASLYSPPPRALSLDNSKLTLNFKPIAEILSRSFVPIYYGSKLYSETNTSIKDFRKSYQKFLKLTLRMTKN